MLHTNDAKPKPAIGISRQQELQLMVHYMNKTSRTLAQDAEELPVWTEAIPEEAMRHDFLMDGLLGMASLHFACYNSHSWRQYTEFSIQYQNSGLKKYNDALGNITEDNCTALFAFSVVLNVMAIALPNTNPDSAASAYTETMMTMLELVRGIGLIHATSVTMLRTGKLAPLFRYIPGEAEPDDETKAALEILRQHANSLMNSGSINEGRHTIYLAGIRALEVAFGCIILSNHFAPIIGWPTWIWPDEHRDELIRLIQHGDVMARVILMHYGVLLLHIRHHWWGKQTGISLIDDVAISVDAAGPSWAPLTRWPREIARQTKHRDQGALHVGYAFSETLL
ncbi:NTF2-like protein [Curvularia clavata]|uniref:NTF2-like protein n=1 Tax=Curvularia clavata TaxID=95742 RepID=A0A9Q8Z9U8_CURCL|nr:NTF2-like protein [Curvularia clavata]